MRVLVIEDDPALRRTLEIHLSSREMAVQTTGTAETGLTIVGRESPDVVLLDLGLPGLDGIEFIRRIRAWSDVPIIVVSARSAEQDKVVALDSGANDYLTKPFGVSELLARIRAVTRQRTGTRPAVWVTEHFRLDLDRRELIGSAGQLVHLTPIEWGLLELLARANGGLVTQRALLTAVWGPEYLDATNTLRVHMTHLRRKLEPSSASPRYLLTEPGLGYRFVAADTAVPKVSGTE